LSAPMTLEATQTPTPCFTRYLVAYHSGWRIRLTWGGFLFITLVRS
jgi:hypothetical protein